MAEGKLADIANRDGTEVDARARRALILNREKAMQAFNEARIASRSGLSDEELVDLVLRQEELEKSYMDACAAVHAFDAARKVAA